MAYSVDLRERVIAYLREGHTQEETRIIFKVGTTTIKNWLALLSETGSLEKRPLERSPSKIESEKLNTYVEENPNALLKDVASKFNGSTSGAFYTLEREKITLKKDSICSRPVSGVGFLNIAKPFRCCFIAYSYKIMSYFMRKMLHFFKSAQS